MRKSTSQYQVKKIKAHTVVEIRLYELSSGPAHHVEIKGELGTKDALERVGKALLAYGVSAAIEQKS